MYMNTSIANMGCEAQLTHETKMNRMFMQSSSCAATAARALKHDHVCHD